MKQPLPTCVLQHQSVARFPTVLKIYLVHICSSRVPHGTNGSDLPLGSHQRNEAIDTL